MYEPCADMDSLPAVRRAVCEDMLGAGLRLSSALAKQLRGIRKHGVPLPPFLAEDLEDTFPFDVERIRLHRGPQVDRVAAGLAAWGFCLGTDIYLTGEVTREEGPSPGDILRHELAHLSNRVEPELVRLWSKSEGKDVHGQITTEACEAFKEELRGVIGIDASVSLTELIRTLANASSNLDYRGRLAHAGGTLPYVAGLGLHYFGVSVRKGEGPPHGEGKNYTDRTWSMNESLNLDEQQRHVDSAVRAFAADRGGTGFFTEVWNTVAGGPEWVRSLGNALHIAQDRAAHREGTQGYGHDDPRCYLEGWKPDDPSHCDHRFGTDWTRCNKAARNRALNNSYEVFEQFFLRVGVNAHHHHRAQIRCVEAGTAQTRRVTVPASRPTQAKAPQPPGVSKGPCTHIVEPGDWLSTIAEKYYGDMRLWTVIWDANRGVIGDNPHLIKPKQRLLIPNPADIVKHTVPR